MNVAEVANISIHVAKLLGSTAAVITGLSQVSNRRPDTQLILQGLVTQVQTLRTALSRIEELCKVQTSCGQLGLLEAFQISLSYCDILVEKLGEDVTTLFADANAPVARLMQRLKNTVDSGSVHELQTLLDRQINALNLLLNIYSCESLSAQTTLLELPANQQILHDAQSDLLSLHVNYDRASIKSQSTAHFSLLSREFSFDKSLLSSKVYSKSSMQLIQLLHQRVRRRLQPIKDINPDSLVVKSQAPWVSQSQHSPLSIPPPTLVMNSPVSRASYAALHLQPTSAVLRQLPRIVDSPYLFSESVMEGYCRCSAILVSKNRRCSSPATRANSATGQDKAEEIMEDFLAMEEKQVVDDTLAHQIVEFIELSHCHFHYHKSRRLFEAWYNVARGAPAEFFSDEPITSEEPETWTHLDLRSALTHDTDMGSVAHEVHSRLVFAALQETFHNEDLKSGFLYILKTCPNKDIFEIGWAASEADMHWRKTEFPDWNRVETIYESQSVFQGAHKAKLLSQCILHFSKLLVTEECNLCGCHDRDMLTGSVDEILRTAKIVEDFIRLPGYTLQGGEMKLSPQASVLLQVMTTFDLDILESSLAKIEGSALVTENSECTDEEPRSVMESREIGVAM